MAASSIVAPARTSRDTRGAAARAAARSAPQGPGLATVVALPLPAVSAPAPGAGRAEPAPAAERAVTLRVVPRSTRVPAGRRLAALVLAATLLVVGVAGIAATALAGPAEPAVAGHVVLQPGETLWDVAVRSAPAGVDPRRQLDTLRRLNGFGPGALDAWTVVLIPAV